MVSLSDRAVLHCVTGLPKHLNQIGHATTQERLMIRNHQRTIQTARMPIDHLDGLDSRRIRFETLKVDTERYPVPDRTSWKERAACLVSGLDEIAGCGKAGHRPARSL